MTKTLNQIIFFFLHQNQNIFFSNTGNQNIFLEKKHNPPPPPFKLNGRSLRIPHCRAAMPTLKQSEVLSTHFMQLSALWCKLLIIVHVLSWIPAWYIRRNRCECITLSNAAFASRSTRCPFCFSSVNIPFKSPGRFVHLYNNTPSKAIIVNAAFNITYRPLIEADDTDR